MSTPKRIKPVITEKELAVIRLHFLQYGPSRVLVSEQGMAMSPGRAEEAGKGVVDIIFIRDDGWTLGCAERLEAFALATWKKEWVAFARKGSNSEWELKPISEY